jgi:hypothetical protein
MTELDVKCQLHVLPALLLDEWAGLVAVMVTVDKNKVTYPPRNRFPIPWSSSS